MLLMVEALSCSMIVLSRKRLRNLSWSYTCATEPKRFADKKVGYLLLPKSFAAVKLSWNCFPFLSRSMQVCWICLAPCRKSRQIRSRARRRTFRSARRLWSRSFTWDRSCTDYSGSILLEGSIIVRCLMYYLTGRSLGCSGMSSISANMLLRRLGFISVG